MFSYCITDKKYYSNNTNIFKDKLFSVLKNHKIDYICLRDKESKNIEELLQVFLDVVSNFNTTALINTHINLAKKYNIGIHLNSNQINNINIDIKLKVISTHSIDELLYVKDKVSMATISPIFKTPNKGQPKGLDYLKKLKNYNIDIPIIALGGIVSEKEVNQLKNLVDGFASIRYFI